MQDFGWLHKNPNSPVVVGAAESGQRFTVCQCDISTNTGYFNETQEIDENPCPIVCMCPGCVHVNTDNDTQICGR